MNESRSTKEDSTYHLQYHYDSSTGKRSTSWRHNDKKKRTDWKERENRRLSFDNKKHHAVREARRAAAELAEKEHQERRAPGKEEQDRLRRVQEQEELDRQAATAQSPVEQVAQQPAEGQAASTIPFIGENTGVQTVSSTSTVSSDSTGASTLAQRRQEREEEEDY
eukprot:2573691-Amphidinium_carterae.1